MSKTVKALGEFAGGLVSFMEGLVMPVETVSATIANSGWTVFWVQLPLLVLAVAVIIVATTALRRARQEDVPRVFEAFAAAFGRRTDRPNRRRQTQDPENAGDETE
jgi:hypothetical protein